MANNLGVSSYTVGGDFDTWGAKFVADMAIFNKLAGDTYAVSNTSGTVTLDATACQNFAIRADGGTASQVDIRVPDGISRWWFVENARASGVITVRCAAGGTSVTLNPSERRMVRSDGTNCTDLVLTTVSIASVVGLQAALDLKAPLASPPLTGTPTAPTATVGTNTTQIATTAFVKAAIDVILGGVSASYDTLIEIVNAIVPAAAKTTPVDADTVQIYDSAASGAPKTGTLSSLWANWLKAKTDATYRSFAPRVSTEASNATPTPNADSVDQHCVTAAAANMTVSAPSGTPVNAQKLIFRFKDNGTARTIGWNAIYRAVGVSLPATTVISKTLYVGCIYNIADSKWDVVAVGLGA